MGLAERLGYKTLSELYATMSNNEIMEWQAFDMLRHPDSYKKIKTEYDLELQKTQTLAEEAQRIKDLFSTLGR